MEKLDSQKINSFEQLYIRTGNARFPIADIDTETALCRIDVCGMLQVEEFIGSRVEDHNGNVVDVEDLLTKQYRDSE